MDKETQLAERLFLELKQYICASFSYNKLASLSNVMVIKEFIPPILYPIFLNSLPDKSFYEVFQQGGKIKYADENRFQLWLKPQLKSITIENSILWRTLIDFFSSKPFLDALIKCFGVSDILKDRNYNSTIRLVKELEETNIPPHLDRSNKFLTMILYLAENGTSEPYGTSLYKKVNNRIYEVHSTSYCSNVGVFILYPNHTLHGVPKGRINGERNTLQQFWQYSVEL